MRHKNNLLKVAFCCLSLFACSTIYAQGWQLKQAPLMTEWAAKVDPENVFPEYPRPQMERSEWINLNGVWDFGETTDIAVHHQSTQLSRKILVPFPIESAISGIMDTDFPANSKKTFVYKRTFEIPESMAGKNILLHFGAVEWRTYVYINGTFAGSHEGGYDPFSFDITPHLTASGQQEITVQVFDPGSDGGQPRGKQHNAPYVIQYSPATGIWQTVWLEPVAKTYIEDFKVTTDIDNNKVTFNIQGVNAQDNSKVTIKVLDEGTEIASVEADLNKDTNISINNPKLWSPDSPFLYDVKFELKNGNEVVDEVNSYFGMRKVSMGKINGSPWVLLNNEPIFQYGVLDQGYWPDGIYTAPTEEALLFDLVKTKEFGFNMVRKHIKTEPSRWYYACDKMGLLIWQDIPNGWEDGDLGDHAFHRELFYKEMKAIMNALKNHPSIITWVLFNESWGQQNYDDTHTKEALRIAKELDNTRIMNSVSGWTDFGVGDLFDCHSYPEAGIFWDESGQRASVCGETGGISLVDDNHKWREPQMEYIYVENNEELKDLFIEYVNGVKTLQASGLCAAVYTQITDVEGEFNGLMFYDRVMKTTEEQNRQIKEAVQSAINNLNVPVLKPANAAKVTWKYTTNYPGDDWMKPEFNDGAWQSGLGGFGSANGGWFPENAIMRTEWNTSNIYLRHELETSLNEEQVKTLKALVYYDEDFEVYFNGILAVSAKGYSDQYIKFDISEEALAAFSLTGTNTIAIHCYQTEHGQYIDFGLYTEVPMSEVIADPTSITTIQNGIEVAIYPNPTRGELHIEGIDSEITSIQLYDLQGSVVKSFNGNMTIIDISDLNNGLYLLQIRTKDNQITKRVIKK